MKKTIMISLFVLVVQVSVVHSQVTVEDDVVTDEVNLFDRGSENQKSTALALSASLLMPGLGHQYVDKRSSAFKYFAFDMASLFGAIVFHGYAKKRAIDASAYASAMANIEHPLDNEAYWRHVGAFMDAKDYNEVIELENRRGTDQQYLNAHTWWRWGDESQQDEYNRIRQQSRHLQVASSFFIGGMILNRIVSMVDLRVSQRKTVFSAFKVQPSVTPDLSGAALSLTAGF